MFDDIEQLEKEVQAFRRNMLGADKLLKSLDAVTAALEAQTEHLNARSAEMAGKMDAQSAALEAKTDDAVNRMSKENKANLEKTAVQITDAQEEYMTALRETDRTLRAYARDLSREHDAFLARLEKTNIDQIYQGFTDMKKTMEARFTVLMAGVGAVVVLAIVGLFI